MPPAAVPSPRSVMPVIARAVLAVLVASAQMAESGVAPVRGDATIPDEAGAFRIDGPSYASLVADLDGDGVRELVRISTTGGDGTGLGVEVWRQGSDGAWAITAPAVELRRGAGAGEQTPGLADKDGLIPSTVGDGVRLLLWRQGGQERTLAVVNGAPAAGLCCLTVWEITEPPSGGPPNLRLLINTRRGGDSIFAVDMDGDGTDELAIQEPGGGDRASSFSVLKWGGARFHLINQPLNVGEQPFPYLLGNSDGLPGDEIGFIGSFGNAQTGFGLTRVSLHRGAIHVETAELPSDGVVLPAVAAEGDGSARIIFGAPDQPLLALSWPADGDTTVVSQSTVSGIPLGVLGGGANRRILMLSGDPQTLDLLGLDLRETSVQTIAPSAAAKPFLKRTFRPYIGPWPDPLPANAQGSVYDGMLLVADSSAPIQVRPMAALPGMAPLGELGRNGEWIALAQRTTPTPSPTDVSRDGGLLLQSAGISVTLARTADVLTPEVSSGAIQPRVENATPTQQALLIGTPDFEATVTAPPASISMAVTGPSDQFHVLVRSPAPNPGVEIGGPPFRIPIVSSVGAPGNQAFDAALYVITPAGHGYTAQWHVRLLRTPPKITAETAFLSLGFGATIQGRTDPSATVTADGQSVHAGPDGQYQLNVGAGLIPREVHLQARDPIGNVSTTTVTAIAPVDYRRLPWIPLVALLTVAAGAILFVRAPRLARRRAASAAPTDDATFEEIDGD